MLALGVVSLVGVCKLANHLPQHAELHESATKSKVQCTTYQGSNHNVCPQYVVRGVYNVLQGLHLYRF